MEDWIKLAQELQLKEELKRQRAAKSAKTRSREILAAEEDWMERVAKRVIEVGERGIHIHLKPTPNGLELSCRGTVDIQFLGHRNFAIKYHHIIKPSHIMTHRPIRIYHHRLARVRELNTHNIEEVLKFAALGMEQYSDTASHKRLENNLNELIGAVNQDEHVEGPDR